MGFQGYPEISILYFGSTSDVAEQVTVSFVAEEGAAPMEEQFKSESDAREDQIIQSAIVKMIERSGIKTVKQADDVKIVREV